MTRGPLPSRVYWFRRVLVLGTAVLLVVAIARLLGGGSDGSDGDDAARLSADSPSSTTSSTTTTDDSGTPLLPEDSASASVGTTGTSGKPGKGQQTSEAPVLAEPTGACAGSDIAVTPEVGNAVGGRDVRIVLQLRTISAEACTWQAGSNTIAVNITSGSDAIWSSRDCPRAIPRQDVVVRRAVTTEVPFVWTQAKRSAAQKCTTGTGWAALGWYHVTAAALGGEPSDVQFELTAPTAATVTVTASPKDQPKNQPKNQPKSQQSGKPSGKPGQSPSGAVEPDAVD